MQYHNLKDLYLWTSGGSNATALRIEDEIGQHIYFKLLLKQPGNESEEINLKVSPGKENLEADKEIPLQISWGLQNIEASSAGSPAEGRNFTTEQEKRELVELSIRIEANSSAYFNLQGKLELPGLAYDASDLYLPGFWYRKNLRSPEHTPSVRAGKNWIVREDRLSTPLAGIFNEQKKVSYSLIRVDSIEEHAMTQHKYGEVILSGRSDLGAVGFGEEKGNVHLSFAYPYREAPHSYFRKLTLGAPVTSFLYVEKGEVVTLRYQVLKLEARDYPDYMKQIWTYSYDLFQPQAFTLNKLSDQEIKKVLTNYFFQSFVEAGDLKGFSGVHLQTHLCEGKKLLEVGFIGRVLLNAFNALEWAEEQQDEKLREIAFAVLDSYEQYGFAKSGFIRELVDLENQYEEEIYSIRRQSEGIYAVLLYLDYEMRKGRKHPLWEQRIRYLLNLMLELQHEDGSFPRKFNGALELIDATGGSSPSAVLPLVMAYKYFGELQYLEAARRVVDYQEKEIIARSDYFSSTLDADCEDKEASMYAVIALYYIAMVTEGAERRRYVELAQKAAYFTLSWYYTWDVPFAPGQMLGDVGLKSRGWGNVSVENNHIDVYVFEFDEVLKWLSQETGEERFAAFAEVIRSSMREQLLPYKGHMVGISKEGYYPEVVQHTDWDYGHFGKGFYNLHFAPGWTVASIWELLTDDRAKRFLTAER